MRRFLLRAVVSDSPSSTLAEGVEFSDGCAVLRWIVAAAYPHIAVFDRGMRYVEALHEDGYIEWVDEPGGEAHPLPARPHR